MIYTNTKDKRRESYHRDLGAKVWSGGGGLLPTLWDLEQMAPPTFCSQSLLDFLLRSFLQANWNWTQDWLQPRQISLLRACLSLDVSQISLSFLSVQSVRPLVFSHRIARQIQDRSTFAELYTDDRLCHFFFLLFWGPRHFCHVIKIQSNRI